MKHKSFTLGAFVRGLLSWGFCPGDFCRGVCPGGGGFVLEPAVTAFRLLNTRYKDRIPTGVLILTKQKYMKNDEKNDKII